MVSTRPEGSFHGILNPPGIIQGLTTFSLAHVST